MRNVLRLLFLVGIAAAVGCSGDEPSRPGGPPAGQVPDFSLTDVNPNSATFDSTLSPRDYLGTVSAWYFGHST